MQNSDCDKINKNNPYLEAMKWFETMPLKPSPINAMVWKDSIRSKPDYEENCWYLGDAGYEMTIHNVLSINSDEKQVNITVAASPSRP